MPLPQYLKRSTDLRPGDVVLKRDGIAWRYDGYSRDPEFPAFHLRLTLLDQKSLSPRLRAGMPVTTVIAAKGDQWWRVVAVDLRVRRAWQAKRVDREAPSRED